MNLTLVRKLLQHMDLNQLLKQIWNNGQNTLITIHCDIEKIHHALERVKKDGEHHWWETHFGWSPTTTGIFEFDAASSCYFASFNLVMFIAYNNSVHQSLAKNQITSIQHIKCIQSTDPTCKMVYN